MIAEITLRSLIARGEIAFDGEIVVRARMWYSERLCFV